MPRILSRRDLLKGSLGLTITATCISALGRGQTLAQPRPSGKPPFVEPEINARIPHPRDRQAYWNAIEFAKRDLLGYLNANFSLTPEQNAQISSMSQEDRMRLNAFLDRARANNLKITVRLMPAGVMPRDVPRDSSIHKCPTITAWLTGSDAGAGLMK